MLTPFLSYSKANYFSATNGPSAAHSSQHNGTSRKTRSRPAGTFLFEAKLTKADVSGADLRSATGLTDVQITAGESLKSATMPDGSIHD